MPQPGLIRNSLIAGIVATVAAYIVLIPFGLQSSILPFVAGIVFGYFYYHQRRETILMKDLIHGRYFKCDSVIDQAKREKWLKDTVAILRQVMEAAKHWDGTETMAVPLLKKEAALKLIAEL